MDLNSKEPAQALYIKSLLFGFELQKPAYLKHAGFAILNSKIFNCY